MRRLASDKGSHRIGIDRRQGFLLGSSVRSSSRFVRLINLYLNFIHHLNLLCMFSFSYLHKNSVLACSWNPNGNLVATASRDTSVRIFDIRTFKELEVFKGHKKDVACSFPLRRPYSQISP
jgi:WD40 repeat protein